MKKCRHDVLNSGESVALRSPWGTNC